ncbi:MAG: hypothetical protein NTZ78_07150 [Candidatus Aureabacteria bacterium]|nr:hypothetical protein [Candidatus Auribacterota bacterium]
MIRPKKGSLHRKPFLSESLPVSGASEAGAHPTAVCWFRSIHGVAPLHLRAGRARRRPPGGIPGDARVRKGVNFLYGNAAALGILDPSQLHFSHLVRSRSGTHLRFQQMYDAVPVIGALLDVHLDRAGAVCAVTGAFQNRLGRARGFKNIPSVTKKDAIRKALADLGPRCRLRAPLRFYEMIYSARQGPSKVYKVELPATKPLGNWVYLIDPFRGTILHSYNNMRFDQGTGKIYLLSPVEDPALRAVPLERMETPRELKGEYVAVLNEDAPEAKSERGLYLFSPEDTHFDEVMAYYHIDRVSTFFSGVDRSGSTLVAMRGPLRAIVHAGDCMDNAYYDPATNGIYLGDGGGTSRLNDLAKEAAVIYHEFTHAVLDHVNPHLKGAEADALHEGYADYFGCSLTDDAQIGEWVVASIGEPHLRDLGNRKRYPRDLEGEAHADGEIWGGACWDLRASLGKEKADSLMYESMHFLPEFARFSDAARGVAQADANIFSGRNALEIAEVFRGRGITLAPPRREKCS